MGTASGAVALLLVVLGASVSSSSGQLQVGFYSKSCPSAESTVASVVRGTAAADSTILPALLRLQFHDCFVRGCDASVLIKGGNNNAEVDNNKHQGLRGMDVIENAKAQLESECPGVVSCADIVVLAARDAVAFTGGPSFDVPTGRRDGKVSNVRDGDVLPDVRDSAQVLRSKFRASGLDDKDLVLLSSAHTVGTTACFFIQDRLYKFPLPGGGLGSDPSIPDGFLSELKSRCAQHPQRLRGDRLRRRALQRHQHRRRGGLLLGPPQHHLRALLPAGLRGLHGEDGQHRRAHRRQRGGQEGLLQVQLRETHPWIQIPFIALPAGVLVLVG
ncbi:unnamed protein product [Triticum turgidum subsp. durum]|uniref:Peroxidase n=1 Tax=Triticum turgidum subsp. durum TaxID=4567 RepID=A0A9R0VZN4_TRITD|nr:unnamed protein product [Triticum turgidum subsp. durum]